MIYHKFVTIQTLLNNYGFQHILLAPWSGSYIGVILYEQMCTQMDHHFSYFIWVTR